MLEKVTINYRNVKNLKISVSASDEVIVTAPIGTSEKYIASVLKEKTSWINKHSERLRHNKKYDYSQKSIVNGDELYFLGKAYGVRLFESNNNVINENGNILEFHINKSVANNSKFKHQLLDEFYIDRADIILNNLVAKFLKITNQEIQRVSIKKMKTRWGSCNHLKKTINLNVDLIQRDIKAVEYVVLHEIAHLTYPNHSKDFYSYVADYMPDWKNREKVLR